MCRQLQYIAVHVEQLQKCLHADERLNTLREAPDLATWVHHLAMLTDDTSLSCDW